MDTSRLEAGLLQISITLLHVEKDTKDAKVRCLYNKAPKSGTSKHPDNRNRLILKIVHSMVGVLIRTPNPSRSHTCVT